MTDNPILNPFAQLWEDIKVEATKVIGEVETIAADLATTLVADIEDVFRVGAPLAVQAIIEQAPKLLSGTEKFGEAVTSVAQSLQTQLGPVAIADVQTLIQTAFRGLQQIAGGK